MFWIFSDNEKGWTNTRLPEFQSLVTGGYIANLYSLFHFAKGRVPTSSRCDLF